MRKMLLAAALVFAGLLSGVAATPVFFTGNVRYYVANGQSCTDATGATPISIQDSTGVFTARFVSIINDGANEVFVDFNGNTATTADVRLEATGSPGSTFTMYLSDNGTNAWACVASSGETTTLRVVAMR